jgi:hypothetical protein
MKGAGQSLWQRSGPDLGARSAARHVDDGEVPGLTADVGDSNRTRVIAAPLHALLVTRQDEAHPLVTTERCAADDLRQPQAKRRQLLPRPGAILDPDLEATPLLGLQLCDANGHHDPTLQVGVGDLDRDLGPHRQRLDRADPEAGQAHAVHGMDRAARLSL